MYKIADQKALEHHLKNGNFTLITGHSSQVPPEQSHIQHNNLLADLNNLGYNYTNVGGKWNNNPAKPSVMVHNMKPEHASQLASKYNQMATIQANKGKYQEASHHPSYSPMTDWQHKYELGNHLNDNYSEVTLANGQPLRFQLK